MQNMAEAGQLHKSAFIHFLPRQKGAEEALKLLASALAAFVFRNVLQFEWTTGCV
jgi:hypothetical protein